jgi:pimeloyl-ACP methyl ester carboxylesterase
MPATTSRITFTGASGAELAARFRQAGRKPARLRPLRPLLHLFQGCVCGQAHRFGTGRPWHCDTAVRFHRLGHSDGDFASTNFSSNVADLISAVDWMRENDQAPSILIGHSLGGAAVLSAAPTSLR